MTAEKIKQKTDKFKLKPESNSFDRNSFSKMDTKELKINQEKIEV